MQLINAPGKLVLPFANAGAKNSIPVDSQIGIVAGAASLTDGFPPLTRTPLAAGGVPPSGLDMNGILYELSAIVRWANAGGGYVYDDTFATDPDVGGYPKGARVLRSDGLGYWFNTVDGNATDPEANAVAAIAAGWVPDFTNGAAAVTMTNANVTLTPLQYGKPVIIISGLLTANLNLIFPTGVVDEWVVINNTTGAYTVTCKTVAGTGVVVNSAQLVVGDGTNIVNGNLDAVALLGANVASAGGTADALTVTLGSTVRSWAQISGIPFWVRAASANTTTTPTVAVNGLAAKTEVKGAGSALAVGDHAGAGHWLLMQYDATLDKVVLLNPAKGVTPGSLATGQCRLTKNGANLQLSPNGGNSLVINGVAQSVPGAGVTLGAGGLTPNTMYYIYAYMNSGVMTLEASTTAHSTDSSGIEIKTGDATRSLVGKWYCVTGPAWSSVETEGLSFFNRRAKSAIGVFTANRSTASGSAVEVNTEIRVGFLTWTDESVEGMLGGSMQNASVATNVAYIGVDGVSTSIGAAARYGNTPENPFCVAGALEFADGRHYATLAGNTSAGTVTYIGNASGANRTTLSIVVRG